MACSWVEKPVQVARSWHAVQEQGSASVALVAQAWAYARRPHLGCPNQAQRESEQSGIRSAAATTTSACFS